MRTVASYSLTLRTEGAGSQRFEEAVDATDAWLRSKGEIDHATTPKRIVYPNARVAEFEVEAIDHDNASLRTFNLLEPTQGDLLFGTRLILARRGDDLALACELRVGGALSGIGPLRFDARRPRIIRDILDLAAGWEAGGTPVSTNPARFHGVSGGRQLIELIWSERRRIPLVVVSDYEGLPLHPDIDLDIAADLAGLAVVAHVDSEAAWHVTQTKGGEWSCYYGAIRLYWPAVVSSTDPYRHPLWTPRTLLTDVPDTDTAALRIRAQLRRQVMGLSAFADWEPPLITEISEAARDAVRRQAQDAGDWKELATVYAGENDSLRGDVQALREENAELRAQLRSYQQALWQPRPDETDIAPDRSTPPNTIAEAFQRAMQDFGSLLRFGSDVDAGVAGLAADAGPPDKVLWYLDRLAEMTKVRSEGSLGTTAIKWLIDRGIVASGESETIRNSSNAMGRRRWNDGVSDREFEYHLKPKEAVAPDQCVRIYFDYDEAARVTIVGWIGRHPD